MKAFVAPQAHTDWRKSWNRRCFWSLAQRVTRDQRSLDFCWRRDIRSEPLSTRTMNEALSLLSLGLKSSSAICSIFKRFGALSMGCPEPILFIPSPRDLSKQLHSSRRPRVKPTFLTSSICLKSLHAGKPKAMELSIIGSQKEFLIGQDCLLHISVPRSSLSGSSIVHGTSKTAW